MRLTFGILMSLMVGTAHANADLTEAIENVRTTCGNISAELTDMKKMAGITTAVTGVGTVTGGVALGTGLAKANVDKEIEELEAQIAELKKSRSGVPVEKLEIANQNEFNQSLDDFVHTYSAELQQKAAELSAAEKKSKQLGNVRTGTMAAATATNIAGAVMSGTNKVKGDLKQQIDECLASVKTLSNVRMQARIDGSANDTDLARAENIIRACDAWSTVDVSSINKRSTGATVSSGIGAGLGLAGTITSASANSNSVRDGDADKEKKLNTAANVLAGGTTAASLSATIFNATQISAIKRAATVADECEGALK
ncbi:MAG: hypothetical protein IJE79_02355 [Alphaproteobacteria bacterium]|nr:hypothetical protein [Alphaproteobacteria bacterium]